MSSLQNFLEIVPVVFAAGESKLFHLGGAYFEIIDAPDPVDVVLTDKNGVQRGVMRNAEASFYIKNTGYDTIQLTSATAQTIRFAFGSSEAGTRRSTGSVTISGNVALDTATLAALESIDLNAQTIDSLRRPQIPTGSWANNASTAANTPLTVFLPAANTNGCWLLSAHIASINPSNTSESCFVAKSSSPTSIVDGQVVLGAIPTFQTSTQYGYGAVLTMPQYIEPGLGLYFISGQATGGPYSSRSARYRML